MNNPTPFSILSLFITVDIINEITNQTNIHKKQYFIANDDKNLTYR